MTNAAGLSTTTMADEADSVTTKLPDGTVITTISRSDARFGMQAPATVGTVAQPSGLARTIRRARAVTLADPSEVLSLRTQVDSILDNGHVSTVIYDAAARTLTARSAEGRTNVVAVDSLGRAVAFANGSSAPTILRYNERGLLRELATAGRTTRFEYDALGQLGSSIDPTGARTHSSRDSLGRPLTMTDAAGSMGFSYDSAGGVQSITPSGRPSHFFRYTPGGLLSEHEAPALAGVTGTITRYRYDGDERLRAVVRPGGDSLAITYDGAGRPSAVSSSDATTTLGFGPLTGQLTSIASTNGSSYSLSYDGALLTSSALGGGQVSGTLSYAYDNFFRRSAIAVNGDTVAVAYDRDGLMRGAGMLAIARNAITGTADTMTLDAVRTTYRYDSTGAVAGASTVANGLLIYEYNLQRDVLDRITRRTETTDGTTNDTRFAYDSAGRLFTVTRDGEAVAAYTYDANGNRTTRTTVAGIESGAVDAQDRLISYGATQYRYTDAGDLASRAVGGDTTTYHYDATGALRWVHLGDGTRIDYLLDPMGRRIGKRVNGALVQGFLYEDDLRIAAELTPAGAIRIRFIYGTQVNVPEYLVRDGQRYRVLTDQMGSVRVVVHSTTGTVAQRLDYDEYGRVTQNTNPGFQPFGYAGGLLDDATGLVRFGARDYDAASGRWTTKDPIGFEGGDANLYSYVRGDPLNGIDPTGLSQLCEKLLRTIDNLQRSIDRRQRDLRSDPFGLPGSCPGDDIKPSLSRRGHQMMINLDKVNLAAKKALYLALCGGDPPNGAPLPGRYFDREFWEKATGLTGAALIAYLIVSEGSRVIPIRNLVPVP